METKLGLQEINELLNKLVHNYNGSEWVSEFDASGITIRPTKQGVFAVPKDIFIFAHTFGLFSFIGVENESPFIRIF